MNKNKRCVCPVEYSGILDNHIRKLFQNPEKILKPYLQEGMTVLDVGCGPGFFSLQMAKMVGESGKVIATDLQEGMLQKIQSKIEGTVLKNRITLHKCEEDKIGILEQFDFILLFYVVHEILDQSAFFSELFSLLKRNGSALIVEPPFHVSKSTFQQNLQFAKEAGFFVSDGPKMLFHQTAIIKK
ncbi:MAG: SAM-dependent methyltransferase [Acidobacteria bacterium]|nr:MAG: SAM-dependent methyltransferase [Acidobacteriota bacterium]